MRRKLKSSFAKLALLCGLLFAAAVVFWSAKPNIKTLSKTTEIALVEIPESGWQTACFAPAYHNLDRTRFDVGSSVCWRGTEVPERWTYLTFYSQDGSCERYRFHADFLVPHGADYRCFPKNESEDIQITISEGVLRLR